MLLCRENAPGGPILTMEVLYQLSYVGMGRDRSCLGWTWVAQGGGAAPACRSPSDGGR
jgi:hypothetical protein